MADSGVTCSRLKAEKLSEWSIFMAFQSPARNCTETRLSLGNCYTFNLITYT